MWPCVPLPTALSSNIVRQEVYAEEMTLYSAVPPLKVKSGCAPGKWFEARHVALTNLSIQHFGLKQGALTQEPAQKFRLMERPTNSNFPDCVTCKANKNGRMDCIKSRLPRATRDVWISRQTQHIADVYAERAVLAKKKQESTRKGAPHCSHRPPRPHLARAPRPRPRASLPAAPLTSLMRCTLALASLPTVPLLSPRSFDVPLCCR